MKNALIASARNRALIVLMGALFAAACSGHASPSGSSVSSMSHPIGRSTDSTSDIDTNGSSMSSTLPESQDDEGRFKTVSAVGMSFDWRIEGNALRGRMRAPTTGWVTVGFNTENQLGGSKLIMGYVAGERVVVEEHIADPPNHRPKTDLGGHHAVSEVTGSERDGQTQIEFLVELNSGDPVDIVLQSGERYFLTMAWSHEDDLYHHSARRTAVEITL